MVRGESKGFIITMREEFMEILARGICLTVDGRQLEEHELDPVLLAAEDSNYTYMRDFEADSQGKIIKVYYDRVSLKYSRMSVL